MKCLAGEGSIQVAGTGGGYAARLGAIEVGPQVTKKGGGGAVSVAGGRQPKSTTGSLSLPSVEASAIYNDLYYP